ncbi:MAG: hypothetical protein O4807_19955 [Trichodesmium sp. St19_bin2]|nr:hypothetical protein [Trichodesmium sp. St19_bin2]
MINKKTTDLLSRSLLGFEGVSWRSPTYSIFLRITSLLNSLINICSQHSTQPKFP